MSQIIHLQRFDIDEVPTELFVEVRFGPDSDYSILRVYDIYDESRTNILEELSDHDLDALDAAVAKRVDEDEQEFLDASADDKAGDQDAAE